MSSNIKPVPLLNAVMRLFTLPNGMIVDEKTKKKRNMRGTSITENFGKYDTKNFGQLGCHTTYFHRIQ